YNLGRCVAAGEVRAQPRSPPGSPPPSDRAPSPTILLSQRVPATVAGDDEGPDQRGGLCLPHARLHLVPGDHGYDGMEAVRRREHPPEGPSECLLRLQPCLPSKRIFVHDDPPVRTELIERV